MEEASPKSLGWIKLYRSSIDSQVFGNAEIWKLWTLCLLKANHSNTWVHLDGVSDPVECKTGEFITGRFSLHQMYYQGAKGKSPKTVWRWLEKLEKWGCLSIKSTNKYSLVTILNYDLYQAREAKCPTNVQYVSNSRPTDVHQMSTNKNEKNEKNEKSGYTRDYVLKLFQELKFPIKEAYSFFDYYDSTNWVIRGQPVKNLKPLIRNWMRRNDQFKKGDSNTRANAEAYVYKN